jgi:hypothetical protein
MAIACERVPLFAFVMPAKAGIQGDQHGLAALDSRIRGNDDGRRRLW